jgi:hypothetical protein
MAVSGSMYRIEKSWLGLGKTAHWWMDLVFANVIRICFLNISKQHVGKVFAENAPLSYVAFQYWPWYPIAVGTIVAVPLVTGLWLTNYKKRLSGIFQAQTKE